MSPTGKPPAAFADHFSGVSPAYARFRPRYPDTLFSWLASLAPRHDLAWDCATGSGQAAVPLARYIDRVAATDASAAQIEHAEPHPRVAYRIANADASGLQSASVDLVTVAQALHWFDLPRFHAEARRVLRPNGILAVWCYARFTVEDEAVARVLDHFYDDMVGPYWPPERRFVEEGYRTLEFPFDEFQAPTLSVTAAFDLGEMAGYLRTWSATQRYRSARGHDPVAVLLDRLAPAWGDPGLRRTIAWPLTVRAGKAPA